MSVISLLHMFLVAGDVRNVDDPRKGASQRLTMEIFLERLHKIDPNLVASEGATYINNHTLMPLQSLICSYSGRI